LTRANLTSGQLRQYLDILVDKKLIAESAEEDRKHIAHRTTEKGMRCLAVYLALKRIIVFPQEG
jgi:predicted transcriptional regulator